MRIIERDIVSAVIYSKDGKMLQALQDPEGGGAYPGCWGIIGGGIETGESEREALCREVLEETGLDISTYPTELIDESFGEAEKTLRDTGERVYCKMQFNTYKVIIADRDAAAIEITLDDEHTAFLWSTPRELRNIKLTPPSVGLFTRLGYLVADR